MEEVILSPHSEVFLVRRFLSQNGFDIIDEDMVIDEEKYYPIIKCVYKDDDVKTDLSDIEEEFGPILIKKKHPVLQDSRLIIETIPAVTYCSSCGQNYETVKYGRECPYCHSGETWLVQGNECVIKEIEAE